MLLYGDDMAIIAADQKVKLGFSRVKSEIEKIWSYIRGQYDQINYMKERLDFMESVKNESDDIDELKARVKSIEKSQNEIIDAISGFVKLYRDNRGLIYNKLSGILHENNCEMVKSIKPENRLYLFSEDELNHDHKKCECMS